MRVRAREPRLEVVLYPPRALPRALPQPQSCIRHPDITWSLYPDFPQTHGSTRNLSVYANLRTVQAHLHRALHGSAPPYLASSFTCVADMPHRRRLRSASTEQLDVPTCRRPTIGNRAFPVAGAKVWNSLPSDVTSASSLTVFKNRLKTYLFRRCYKTV